MSENNRTPGPWQVSRFVDHQQYRKQSQEWKDWRMSEERHIIRGPGVVGTPECNIVATVKNPADGPMVAAAPELLSLLDELFRKYKANVHFFGSMNADYDEDLYLRVEDVIKKALS